MSKIKLILLVCLMGYTKGFGQTTTNFAPDLNVKTPEESVLLKFLDTPVSYSTGLPSISVPIYTIKQGDITYPISIDYNSSGVNVNERAGWVGMGCSINQPQVTRMIKGLADDKGGFITENLYKTNNGYVEGHWIAAYTESKAGTTDLESDEYRVMLPNGENIRFYFSQDRSTQYPYGEIIQVPVTNNKITPIVTSTLISGWEVTGSDGFIYTYTAGNSTSSTQSYIVNDNLPTLDGKSNTGSYLTSWMLAKIKSPTNNELNFAYASYAYNDCNLTGQRRDVGVDMGYLPVEPGFTLNTTVQTNFQKTVGTNYYLDAIYGDFGRVNFTLDSNPREDYSYGKKLNAITVYDKSMIKVNSYALDYIFKTSPAPVGAVYSCGYIHNPDDLTKRMFLDRITILGNIDILKPNKPFYAFKYNAMVLPHRFSYATDWWGYYNGADSNVSLVPTRFRYDPLMPERNVNSAYSQAGLLTEIVYPTGGSTKYEFESNRGINDRPLTKHVFMSNPNNFESGYVDGINIIPSVKTDVDFNSTLLTPVSNVSYNGGRKAIYQMPFIIGDNAIGYYYSMLDNMNYTVNLPVTLKTSCATCIYGEGSLPDGTGCSIYFRILKNGATLVNNVLISGSANRQMEFAIGTEDSSGLHIASQNYTLVVEIYTGRRTTNEQLLNLVTDNVNINLSWDVYNPALVNKIGAKYDMAMGGHRIKSIKTLENPASTPLEKRYEYKDETGVESGYCNFRLANFFKYANYFYLNSDNYYPLQFYHGQPVGYSYVKEKAISGTEEKVSTYKYLYFTNPNPNSFGACYLFNGSYGSGIYPCIDDPINGMLIENKIGAEKKTITDYTTPNPTLNIKNIIGFNVSNRVEADYVLTGPDYAAAKYSISNFYDQKPWKVTSTDYFNGLPVETITTNTYNTTSHMQLSTQNTTVSGQAATETRFYYPPDLAGQPGMDALTTANRISAPVKTETYRDNIKLSEQRTVYINDATTSSLLLPKNVYAAKFPNSLPTITDVGTLERKITFDKYDDRGNVLQYTPENGMPVSVIWGYNKAQPIAKLENVAYASIATATITDLQTKSNADINAATETTLRTALNGLRTTFPSGVISTYTYNPLIGVTSMTDARGYVMYYNYDAFGRLLNVKDAAGSLLSENEYHYKN